MKEKQQQQQKKKDCSVTTISHQIMDRKIHSSLKTAKYFEKMEKFKVSEKSTGHIFIFLLKRLGAVLKKQNMDTTW